MVTTITLRPTGAGYSTMWPSQYPAYGSHWDKLDEAPTDENSTYIGLGSLGEVLDLFTHDGYVGDGDISEVRLLVRGCNNAGGSSYSWWKGALRISGTNYYGSEVNYATTIPYTTWTWTWTTNPATTIAWRWSDIEALQFGIAARNGTGGDTTRCTQIYLEIDFTPAESGGNIFSGAFF